MPGAQRAPPPLPSTAKSGEKKKKKVWAKVGAEDAGRVFAFDPHALKTAPLDVPFITEHVVGVHHMVGAGEGSLGAFAVVLDDNRAGWLYFSLSHKKHNTKYNSN